ncbi:uncharacterized protein LOC119433643 [Dermacentor silvarum]|uniref:uncharacterized protein LOC119433643 n=1 Tax=Dermacentor silvarum TaxID=543639 RepID=UPI002100EF02|nr:uncharacterized protein LOC119433643 [Dermacentor silvarum]
MSPNVPLLVQVYAGYLFFVFGGVASFPVDGYCLQPDGIDAAQWLHGYDSFCTSSFDVTMPSLRHVDMEYGAPSLGTLTSRDHRRTARPVPIKGASAHSCFSGHGSTAVTMSPNVPLLVQVGERKYGFHSDYLCLIVLPCPRRLVHCICDCFSMAFLLLRLSGDIESNPGPITEKMFEEMINTQKEILAKISVIQENQTSSEARILEIQARLLAMENKLLSVDESRKKLTDLESVVSDHETAMSSISRQLDGFENRSRRNNLIVRGIKEEVRETQETLLKKVNNDIFENKLGQKLNSIERIHRLEKKTTGKDRPVIMKLTDFRDKMKILQNCHKLKNTNISISEDYSKRVTEIRQKLWKSSDEERRNGMKVKLIFDKVKIGDVLYSWDEVTGGRVKCHTPTEASHM